MSRPLISVVMATYQRRHLLERSLRCYELSKGIDPKGDLEIVVIDDSSTDGTKETVQAWSNQTGIRATVLCPYPKRESWRDCGAILNCGIRTSLGKHVLLTHPEVMPGLLSVKRCVDELEGFEKLRGPNNLNRIGLYACCRVYYLSPRDQVLLDTVDWKNKGALAVREIPQFYEEDTNGVADYMHRATDIVAQPNSRMPTWESWVFGGCSRETWKRLGGMLESQLWGSVDIAFHARRRTLGIGNHTCPEEGTIVIHQNHNLPGDIETPRDMNAWQQELSTYDLTTPSRLVYPAVDNLGW